MIPQMEEDWGRPIFTPPVNEQGQAIGLANLILKLRTYRKEEGHGSKESKTMGKEDKKKENSEQRRRRKEQDHLPVAGSGNYTSEAIHLLIPITIIKTGFIGIWNQERQQ